MKDKYLKRIKAYSCYVGSESDGCTVIFARSRNEARKLALNTETCEDAAYIDVVACRMPDIDLLYRGKVEGDWDDMQLRKALVEKHGWTCLEPDPEECKVCGLCMDPLTDDPIL